MSHAVRLASFLLLLTAREAAAQCVPYDPGTPPGAMGAAPVTNPRFYFLSEIGGCPNLECWVENVANTSYSLGTLVIDQSCTLNDTLTLPPRFVLAGVGTICNAWRITNNILSGATRYGIYERYSVALGAILNTGVYAQNRIESNDIAGVFISGHGAVVRDNEFELNGNNGTFTAIRVHSTADHTKILGNMYSGDSVANSGTNTECAFNALLFSPVQPACP